MSIFFRKFLSKNFFSFSQSCQWRHCQFRHTPLLSQKMGAFFRAHFFIKKFFYDFLKRDYQLASDYEGVVYIAIAVRPKYVLKVGLY